MRQAESDAGPDAAAAGWPLLPQPEVGIADLAALWQHDDIIIRCIRPPGLEDQPDIAQRFRGALGNALEELCALPLRRRDPFGRESAHQLLFGWHSPRIPSCFGPTEVAVPMVVAADMTADRVDFTVRLFGGAAVHCDMAAAAAVQALTGGMALRRRAIRVPFAIEDVRWRRFDGAARRWADGAAAAHIRLLSPIIIRSGQRLQLDPAAALRSAMRRAVALAPWMGLRLAADRTRVDAALAGMQFTLAIHPEQWVRTSKREAGVPKAVYAYGGDLWLHGNLTPLVPYLQLAEFAALGGECASGFGRIALTLYP